MKYRDENEDFQELYFKASDTLPVGTEVDYDGETAPAGWEEIDEPKDTYSTSEVKTNKVWIDNRPIYRKVIFYETPTSKVNNSVSVNISSLSINNIIDCRGISSNKTIILLSDTQAIGWDADYTRVTVYFNNSVETSVEGYLILEYTKTTDQGGN